MSLISVSLISFLYALLELFSFMCVEVEYLRNRAKIFTTFLVQFFFIGIFVYIGIVTHINKAFNYYDDRLAFGLTFGLNVGFSFILCVYLLIQIDKIDGDCCCYFYIIIYIPIIILFFFCFSSFTSDESIIAFIIVTFFKLLSIVIFLIFCGYKTFWLLFLICLISDGITIPLQFLLFPILLESG